MKYIVDVLKKMPDTASYNAWQKAPADVIKTLKCIGAIPVFIIVPELFKPFSILMGLINTLKICLKIKKGDELYLQRYGFYINLLVSIAKRKKVVLNYIIHDLTFLRLGKANGGLEISVLKKADNVFVHTEAMAKVIKDNNLSNGKIFIMNLFDYYSDDAMMTEQELLDLRNKIAFAGNLGKSTFLRTLSDTEIPENIEYRLYGIIKDCDFSKNKQLKYMGSFIPSNTGFVKAGWGLLWDGDSIDTCSGYLGDYLRINSSHKISLYLANGMPIILWKESSLADFLSGQGACVLIDRLVDIPSVLNNITDEQYMQLVNNAQTIGRKLRQGDFLRCLISQ